MNAISLIQTLTNTLPDKSVQLSSVYGVYRSVLLDDAGEMTVQPVLVRVFSTEYAATAFVSEAIGLLCTKCEEQLDAGIESATERRILKAYIAATRANTFSMFGLETNLFTVHPIPIH